MRSLLAVCQEPSQKKETMSFLSAQVPSHEAKSGLKINNAESQSEEKLIGRQIQNCKFQRCCCRDRAVALRIEVDVVEPSSHRQLLSYQLCHHSYVHIYTLQTFFFGPARHLIYFSVIGSLSAVQKGRDLAETPAGFYRRWLCECGPQCFTPGLKKSPLAHPNSTSGLIWTSIR